MCLVFCCCCCYFLVAALFLKSVSVPVTYCCLINHLQTYWLKTAFILFTHLQLHQPQWGQLISLPLAVSWDDLNLGTRIILFIDTSVSCSRLLAGTVAGAGPDGTPVRGLTLCGLGCCIPGSMAGFSGWAFLERESQMEAVSPRHGRHTAVPPYSIHQEPLLTKASTHFMGGAPENL